MKQTEEARKKMSESAKNRFAAMSIEERKDWQDIRTEGRKRSFAQYQQFKKARKSLEELTLLLTDDQPIDT